MPGLPKFPVPMVEILIPSRGKKSKFARFRVAEEKILLIAKESGESSEILTAIKQMIENCLQDPTVDVERLSMTDIEWLFVKLFEASVSNQVKITIHDPEDDKDYELDVDLGKVRPPVRSENQQGVIKLSDDYAVTMIPPPASMYGSSEMMKAKDPIAFLIARCITNIYAGDEAYDTKNATDSELDEWVMNLDSKSYAKLREFVDTLPTMEYTVEYVNSKGTAREFTLRTISDFFTL